MYGLVWPVTVPSEGHTVVLCCTMHIWLVISSLLSQTGIRTVLSDEPVFIFAPSLHLHKVVLTT